MTDIVVLAKVYRTDNDDGETSDDAYRYRGTSQADITIQGIAISGRYSDIAVPFDVVPNQPYYLLWADYSTGDSFGSDDNQHEWIDLYQTPEAAWAAQRILQAASNKGLYAIKYTRDCGTVIELCMPWVGYFENLNNINVETVQLLQSR